MSGNTASRAARGLPTARWYGAYHPPWGVLYVLGRSNKLQWTVCLSADCFIAATGLIKADPLHADTMLHFARAMRAEAAKVRLCGVTRGRWCNAYGWSKLLLLPMQRKRCKPGTACATVDGAPERQST